MLKRWWILASASLTLTTLSSGVGGAQGSAGGHSTVTGIVFDSLVANAPFVGAEVTVDGTELSAITDARGQFRIDGVRAGRAVLRFYHARLDSLGFGAAPAAVIVPDSGVVSVRLATPTAARLRAGVCPGAQPTSTGAVLGRVRNVDDRAPLANAAVTASWSEWSVGKEGLVRGDGRRTATSNANGAFALCGVPNDVAVVVRATAGGHVTGLVEVDLAHRLFTVRDLAVSLADSGSSVADLARLDSAVAGGDSADVRGGAAIQGVVRAPDGKVVDQAQVAVFGFPISARTGTEGTFALVRLPAGTQTLDARAIGYAPKRLTIDVRTGERKVLDVPLERANGQELAPVNIVGRGTKLDRTGFEDRRRTGLGQFVTDEEIKRRGVFEPTQALWNILGARVVWAGTRNVVKLNRPIGSGRGGGGYQTLCSPLYWIDGVQLGDIGEDVDSMVRAYEIRGIEVYLDPSAAPPRYRMPNAQCGIVLIWTKPSQPKTLKQP